MTRAVETPDPLAVALEPPPNETPAERWAREQAEAHARRVSDQIDSEIKAEKMALKKRKPPIKVLLLGQSESGKSTTVKNFQLAYAKSSFQAEQAAWRAVVHLNLVRSVTSIMNAVAAEFPDRSATPIEEDEDDDDSESVVAPAATPLTDVHRALLQRLEPLRRVQRLLEKTLGAASTEETNSGVTSAAPWSSGRKTRLKEFAVTSRSGWKAALNRVRGGRGSLDGIEDVSKTQRRRTSVSRVSEAKSDSEDGGMVMDEAIDIIASCTGDMNALWLDPEVKALLDRKKMRLEEGPGFFLDDIQRVAARGYVPSEEDVVRARLRTMGVQEHRFVFEKGSEMGREWLIYDVGGARSLRNAWYPYFDDINAIIFLAPISCFDERLAEDRRVNRLQDSLMLWKAVCSTKLLSHVQLILFLNKCDLLQKKLTRGVKVIDYITTYGTRANDAPTAAKYFRAQFRDTLSKHSPTPRNFYSYLTSVVDTNATAIQVAAVREGIQRNYLKNADII